MEEDGSAARKKGEQGYAVTLTGIGVRVHLASPNIGVETPIQDVVYTIKYNDLDDFVLVGHSLAWKVAAVADRVPDRVKMVVYLDAARPEKAGAPSCPSTLQLGLGRCLRADSLCR